MIEDYIMETMEREFKVGVNWIVAVTREALACTEEEVQDAIIRLEAQGRVRGTRDKEGLAKIELACPCDTCRFKKDNYNPPNQCPNFEYFFDAFMAACGTDDPVLKTAICDKRETIE